MLAHQTQARAHPFANRHARHHDDEFAETIRAIELKNRAQVDVGFASAGFHFDGKVGERVEHRCRHRHLQPHRRLDGVRRLHRAHIVHQRVLRDRQRIANAHLAPQSTHIKRRVKARLCAMPRRALPGEQIDHRVDRVKLIRLTGVKLNFHAV